MIFLPRNHKFFAISRRGRWWSDLKWDEHILTNGWLVVVISMGSRLIVVGIFFQIKLLNVHPLLVGIEGLRCVLYAAELSGYIYYILAFKKNAKHNFKLITTKFVLLIQKNIFK